MSQDQEPLNVFSLLTIMLEQCASIAWQKMGLQPDPVTGQIHKDLSQAKVAIDVAANLGDHLKGNLDEDDRRQLQSLIRDLQINFVEKQKESI